MTQDTLLKSSRLSVPTHPWGVSFTNGEASGNDWLDLEGMSRLGGMLAGHSFVKLVIDRQEKTIHFLNHEAYAFHADYITEVILGRPREEMERDLDAFNATLYFEPDRRFLLGILSLHHRLGERLLALETIEVDTMDIGLIRELFDTARARLEPSLKLFFKPSNHLQEDLFHADDIDGVPVIWNHDLFEMSSFFALNYGATKGRLRVFESIDKYRAALPELGWSDIIVMPRVPDDIPRVAGFINTEPTTPLSHTNVLAHGWHVPNAVQRGAIKLIDERGLRDCWVLYRIDRTSLEVELRKLDDSEIPHGPSWAIQTVQIGTPDVERTPIKDLTELRMEDSDKFGTKAANLGEIHHILRHQSNRLLGFYRIQRPPRENLLTHLARFLAVPNDEQLEDVAWKFMQRFINIPRGIAIPFSFQKEFLASSPPIQQQIGRLKMALELNAPVIDPLCIALQKMIREQRIPAKIRDYIDAQVVRNLSGSSSFVVRSSSNAEDLDNFSAAGLYQSVSQVTTAEYLFKSIKEVWASLVTPRSVRIQHAAGIPLDHSYMAVIVQEEIKGDLGGVLVTTNPLEPVSDFRNVFINASLTSVARVVDGTEQPFQFLYNTVEGGGRTLAVGAGGGEVVTAKKEILQKLAFAGRLLQSHFANDYTFSSPLDIEWAIVGDTLFILQLRPYAQ